MASNNELERLARQPRRVDELLQAARRAREMAKSGDLAGAVECLVESVMELAPVLQEEVQRPSKH